MCIIQLLSPKNLTYNMKSDNDTSAIFDDKYKRFCCEKKNIGCQKEEKNCCSSYQNNAVYGRFRQSKTKTFLFFRPS